MPSESGDEKSTQHCLPTTLTGSLAAVYRLWPGVLLGPVTRRHLAVLGSGWLACVPTPQPNDHNPGAAGDTATPETWSEENVGGDGPTADDLDTDAENDGSQATEQTEDSDEAGLDEGSDIDLRFDLGPVPDVGWPDGDECKDLEHHPCDAGSADLLQAIGGNCPGEAPAIDVDFRGTDRAIGLRNGFGVSDVFLPTEGQQFLVLGSGSVAELDLETPEGDLPEDPRYCNARIGDGTYLEALPPPINPEPVGPRDCIADPTAVGAGDCSNSLAEQWQAAANSSRPINDYAELRLHVTVPDHVHGLSFDLAFLTTEYPFFFESRFNDMFIAWLEASNWTGNISFDDYGRPISLNASFLEYKDVPEGVDNDPDCSDGCSAPELAGTCIRSHAATGWLTTTAPVVPGDDITLVFAIFDMSDAIVDSYVFIDNLRWKCEAPELPKTDPPSRAL